uniref:(northern house mosquito) hypothetical protein n=1 Tax=Culex pipiens TaxID=7175 RepID=A0A8D8DW30_CULPI
MPGPGRNRCPSGSAGPAAGAGLRRDRPPCRAGRLPAERKLLAVALRHRTHAVLRRRRHPQGVHVRRQGRRYVPNGDRRVDEHQAARRQADHRFGVPEARSCGHSRSDWSLGRGNANHDIDRWSGANAECRLPADLQLRWTFGR